MLEDTIYTCNICGREIGISCFSSRGYTEILQHGWECKFEKITRTVEGKIIKSKYTGVRTIKDYKKNELYQIITCDVCVLNRERYKKLKKIKENVGRRII